MSKPIVIVESPYAGSEAEIRRNMKYVRAAMRDCFLRGEVPFASHALYTQPGVLDDKKPEERRMGIEGGYAFWSACDKVVFYTDLGWSSGMLAAKERATERMFDFEERSLPDWKRIEVTLVEPEESQYYLDLWGAKTEP